MVSQHPQTTKRHVDRGRHASEHVQPSLLSSCRFVSRATAAGPASKTIRPQPSRRLSHPLRLGSAPLGPPRPSHRRRISSSPLTGDRYRLRHVRSPMTASFPLRGPYWSPPTEGRSRRRRVRSRRLRRRSTLQMDGVRKVIRREARI